MALILSAVPLWRGALGAAHTHIYYTAYHFVIPSLAIMLGVSVLDHLSIRRLGSLVFAGMVFLMMLVPFIGPDIKGAQRWINLGGFSLQPSEFIKPAFAIVSAWLISFQKSKPDKGNIFSAMIYALVVFSFDVAADFRMTTVLTCMFAAQVFIAGLPFAVYGGHGFAGCGGCGVSIIHLTTCGYGWTNF